MNKFLTLKKYSYGYQGDSKVINRGVRRVKYRSKSNMSGRLPIEMMEKTEKILKEMFIAKK